MGKFLCYFVELLLVTECTRTAIKYGWMSYFVYEPISSSILVYAKNTQALHSLHRSLM